MSTTQTGRRQKVPPSAAEVDRIGRLPAGRAVVLGLYGLAQREQLLDLDSPRVRLRVQEVGSGDPIVFIHGTAGASPVWAPLIRELADFRCILVDRPGWGLSSMVDYSSREYGAVASAVLVGVLDALDVDRSHAVGASVGDVWALRLAESQPTRIERVVLIGGGPLFADIEVPGIIRAIASPIGALMVRLPEKPARVRSILREWGWPDPGCRTP